MGIAVSIVSAILKSVVGDKFGSGLAKDLIGISIDGISEKGINEITNFINGEKSKIDSILSKENMKSMGIPEDKTDYVVVEIKDLFSKISITDEVLRQCKFDSMNLSAFLWNKYYECKKEYVECEGEIKRCLFTVAEVLIKLLRESEAFEKDVLIQISNAVDDVNLGLQNIYDYIKDNFDKLDDNSQIVLNLLLVILEQIQKMNMRGNEEKSNTGEKKKFKNNKKEDYIKNWNSRLFLHVDNDENPITLADAFIMPDYKMYSEISRIGFSASDTLEQIIGKFEKYDKTSTMLFTGVPGIGKSTIASWIANKYKLDDRVIILRFRDWEYEEIESELLKAICNTLECQKSDLEDKILVLDGFDEMKPLHDRNRILKTFITDIKDYKNLKCIITSRPTYIEINRFQNAFEVLEFDIQRIETFYKKVKGEILSDKKKIEKNLEVFGIPVILYMAMMSGVDISENPTKPEIYNKIFATEGGIFDKFSHDGTQYDVGNQILRDPENIKRYLQFLQEVAFKMFEKGELNLLEEDFHIPKLEFQGELVSIVEFPIKYLFENAASNIEFIHKSIYEYFVSEYIFVSLFNVINESEQAVAKVLGKSIAKRLIQPEILEFLKYKINKTKLNDKFDNVKNAFQLMMRDGMTYHSNECYKNAIDCEMCTFANMMEIMHLWDKNSLTLDNSICNYISYNVDLELNLENIDLEGKSLAEVRLVKAKLNGANLKNAKFNRANLSEVDFRYANLEFTNLEDAILRNSILRGNDLRKTFLLKADLSGSDMRETYLSEDFLVEADLTEADLDCSIWYVNDIQKVLSQLRKAKFIYIMLEEQEELRKVYRGELFPDEE